LIVGSGKEELGGSEGGGASAGQDLNFFCWGKMEERAIWDCTRTGEADVGGILAAIAQTPLLERACVTEGEDKISKRAGKSPLLRPRLAVFEGDLVFHAAEGNRSGSKKGGRREIMGGRRRVT